MQMTKQTFTTEPKLSHKFAVMRVTLIDNCYCWENPLFKFGPGILIATLDQFLMCKKQATFDQITLLLAYFYYSDFCV